MRSPVIRAIVWFLSVVACVAGMVVTYQQTLDHLKKQGYATEDRSLFDLNAVCGKFETADCEEVDESPYAVCSFRGEPFFRFGSRPGSSNVPVALLGMVFFTAVLCWMVLVGSCTPSRWWAHLILLAGTAVGVGVSLFFEYLLWIRLKEWCPPCVFTHLLSGLLFLFGLLLWPRQPRPAGGWGKGETDRPTRVSGLTAPPLDWPPVRNVIVAPIVALVAISAELLLLTPAEVPGAQEHPPQVAESEPANRAETITALSLRPSADLAAEIVGLQTKLNLAQANELSWRQKAEYYQNRQQQTSTSKPEEREKAIAALTTQPSEKLATQIVDLQGKLGSTQRMEAYWKQQFDYYDKRWQHAALSWSLIPAVPINLTDRPVRGPADAVHTMVIFTDFQCPHCKKFEDFVHNTVIPLSQSRGGMKVVFRHWPICQDCNTHAGTNLHPLACQASLAAEAARIVGGNEAFWKMHDLLWARQSEWRRTRDFAALAREISLDVAAFTRAMDSDEAMKRVKADIEEGVNLGKNVEGIRAQDLEVIKVDSTPSVFVDNKRLWRLGQHPSFWGTILESRPRAMPAERPASARQEGMGPTAPPRGVSSRPTQ